MVPVVKCVKKISSEKNCELLDKEYVVILSFTVRCVGFLEDKF